MSATIHHAATEVARYAKQSRPAPAKRMKSACVDFVFSRGDFNLEAYP